MGQQKSIYEKIFEQKKKHEFKILIEKNRRRRKKLSFTKISFKKITAKIN